VYNQKMFGSSKKRVAVNGFGRIGRLFLRQAFSNKEIEIVAINDLADIEDLAYLLRHDTVYRDFGFSVSVDGQNLVVDGKKIVVLQEKDPALLPWGTMNVDVVVECTGLFESFEKASVHVAAAGAKHVVISAPAKDAEGLAGGKTILMGINDETLKNCSVSSNGSCTTNATAPIVHVLNEAVGISKAMLSTVHAYTATQSLTDSPAKGKDFRRGRAAAQNIVPSTTGAAVSVTRAITDLQGKFDGIAIRVPVITGSLIDLTFVAKEKTSVEEINNAFAAAASSSNWKGILGVTKDQPVSSDMIGMNCAVIVDLEYTKVVDGDLVKVLAWYDNEWGYVTTLISHVLAV
jgi:glyceraldehyde 3-phosphate dehydrogenase